MHTGVSETAALVSDPARAAMLLALLGGAALPAGELAHVANVAPQTASSHLARLLSARLLAVEQQGRHRYYRLASAEVASAMEGLLALTSLRRGALMHTETRKRLPEGVAYARSCYSHLAGSLAVEIAEALTGRELIVAAEPMRYVVTGPGVEWFARRLGIDVEEMQPRNPRFARRCLDWTERRHHLAGHLGSAMFGRLKELKWVAPVRGSRAVRVTLEGERRLGELLGVRVRMRS